MIERLIHIGDQLFLSGSVRERKFQFPDGALSLFLPVHLIIRPSLIGAHQLPKPLFQILKSVVSEKVLYFLSLHIAIGHADTDIRQVVLLYIDEGITLCLRQMHHDRLFHPADIHVSPFDLIDDNCVTQTVRILFLRQFHFFRYFCLPRCLLSGFGRLLGGRTKLPHCYGPLNGGYPIIKTDRHFPQDPLRQFSVNDAVRPAFHNNIVAFRMVSILQRHFGMIIRPHALLQHAVDPASLLHGIFGGGCFSVVYIAASQNKFYKIADGCDYFHGRFL